MKWIVSLMLTMTSTVSAAQQYAVTRLGVLPGDKVSVAYGINESGQVVGFSGGGFDFGRKAVVWNGGVITPLAHLSGKTYSTAFGINDAGTIAGFSSLGSNGGTDSAAVRWSAPDAPQDILPGTGAFASGINASGQITGTYHSATSFHPYIWQEGAGSTTLATTDSSYTAGVANAINAAGQVAGHQKGAFTAFRGVRWTGAPHEIVLADGFDNAQALGINVHGHVVGGIWNAAGDNRAFVWSGAGSAQALPLGDLSDASALAINDAGQIVGEIFDNDRSVARHAALWEAGVAYDLNDLIHPASGWELTAAWGINESGQIVGHGVYNGQIEAFLLNAVPEPAGFVGLMGAALPLFSRRRARGADNAD